MRKRKRGSGEAGKRGEKQKIRKNFREICVNQCNRPYVDKCFFFFRGNSCNSWAFFPGDRCVFCELVGANVIFYFFVDKSKNLYHIITMKMGNDFLMRFDTFMPGEFPQGKIKDELRKIEKNQWPVKKIDACQKKKLFLKKESCFPKKEGVLKKRKPFFKKGSCFEKKEALFQKRKVFCQKGSCFPKKEDDLKKKEAVLPKRKLFSKKGRCFEKTIDV